MNSIKNFRKTLKNSLFFILLVLLINACSKNSLAPGDNNLVRKEDTLKEYSPVVSFDVTGRLLEGKHISCIEPDYKGNTWISSGKELYFKKCNEEKTYTLDFPILDISIAGDETLWIGTDGGGLGHLAKDTITWYTKAKSDLPRDYINNVEVGLDGRVWFSSGQSDLGGLVVYDGKKFKLFTPDNSILNQHVIYDIGIDHDGSIYVVTYGTVNHTNVYRISDNSWKCLGENFYWVSGFTVSPMGIIYIGVDFILSSSYHSNNLIIDEFMDNTWKTPVADFLSGLTLLTAIKADRRNFCWAACISESSYSLNVYNGNEWQEAPKGLFLNDKITTIEVDNNNKIWVGTDKNGIFMLNQ